MTQPLPPGPAPFFEVGDLLHHFQYAGPLHQMRTELDTFILPYMRPVVDMLPVDTLQRLLQLFRQGPDAQRTAHDWLITLCDKAYKMENGTDETRNHVMTAVRMLDESFRTGTLTEEDARNFVGAFFHENVPDVQKFREFYDNRQDLYQAFIDRLKEALLAIVRADQPFTRTHILGDPESFLKCRAMTSLGQAVKIAMVERYGVPVPFASFDAAQIDAFLDFMGNVISAIVEEYKKQQTPAGDVLPMLENGKYMEAFEKLRTATLDHEWSKTAQWFVDETLRAFVDECLASLLEPRGQNAVRYMNQYNERRYREVANVIANLRKLCRLGGLQHKMTVESLKNVQVDRDFMTIIDVVFNVLSWTTATPQIQDEKWIACFFFFTLQKEHAFVLWTPEDEEGFQQVETARIAAERARETEKLAEKAVDYLMAHPENIPEKEFVVGARKTQNIPGHQQKEWLRMLARRKGGVPQYFIEAFSKWD